MSRFTSTKRRRLVIIVAVFLLWSGGGFAYQQIGSTRADNAAEELAGQVYDQLRSHDRDDVNALFTDMSIARFEGRDISPFGVDGADPELTTEIADGFLVRYRIERLSATRCVDALWLDDDRFRVRVNRCTRYERS